MVEQAEGKTALSFCVFLVCLVLHGIPFKLDHALYSTGERQLVLFHVIFAS